jgi:ATP-dependent DNA helicase HFM1/MER3
VAAPTGCGKTVIFELAIIRMLTKYPKMDAKCIYIAPNKALCQQKVVEWKQSFGALGAFVVEITGDSALENTMRLVAKASIIVTTVCMPKKCLCI